MNKRAGESIKLLSLSVR
ncbi:hypothetical protein AYI68_g2114, partial [Smittium mucronatum]